MTPLEFEILSHIYASPSKFRECPLWGEVTSKFLDMGVIIRDVTENGFCTTSLGIAWITDILMTPVPKLAYIGREGNILPTHA
ncbi:hypothetical protein KAR91_08605 [Candidatus Pacearchaeota archaeon]|nr:hypothetical protein [Candidatus Pacearchaeota archaeon]